MREKGGSALPDSGKCKKIPRSAEQGPRLEALAAAVSEAGPKTSAGQVASVLLSLDALAGEGGR